MNYDLQSKMLTKTAEYLECTGVLAVCVERVYKAAESIDELEKRAKNAEKIVDEYAESARAIALWLSGYCDKTLSYPSMISNAARKISVAYADMEKRAEQAEKERDDYKELFFAYKHVCGGVEPDRIGELVEADKDGRCMVLPFKPHKAMWSCSKSNPKPAKAYYATEMGILADMKAGCVFGETPEAAKAALAKEE